MARRDKRPFLVVYDYGQGGIWAYVLAQSANEIESRFPDLRVVATRPDWMDDEREARIRKNRTLDIDAVAAWLRENDG